MTTKLVNPIPFDDYDKDILKKRSFQQRQEIQQSTNPLLEIKENPLKNKTFEELFD